MGLALWDSCRHQPPSPPDPPTPCVPANWQLRQFVASSQSPRDPVRDDLPKHTYLVGLNPYIIFVNLAVWFISTILTACGFCQFHNRFNQFHVRLPNQSNRVSCIHNIGFIPAFPSQVHFLTKGESMTKSSTDIQSILYPLKVDIMNIDPMGKLVASLSHTPTARSSTSTSIRQTL
jgi:hypothetical protein